MEDDQIKLAATLPSVQLARLLLSLKQAGCSEDKIIDLFEQRIINLKNPNLSLTFLNEIKEANFKAHEEVILNGNDAAVA